MKIAFTPRAIDLADLVAMVNLGPPPPAWIPNVYSTASRSSNAAWASIGNREARIASDLSSARVIMTSTSAISSATLVDATGATRGGSTGNNMPTLTSSAGPSGDWRLTISCTGPNAVSIVVSWNVSAN